jgi:hypothetical protein
MSIWKKRHTLIIEDVIVNDKMVCFFINDGQTVSMSVSLFPALHQLEHDSLRNCSLVSDSSAVYWPDCDLTISLSEVLND